MNFTQELFAGEGIRYEKASHQPIISKELYAYVQEKLRSPHKSKSKKGLFAYSNIINCGVCNSRLTGEIIKAKYIYYHCTGNKGKCNQSYLKEEVIDNHFEQIHKSIKIDPTLHQTLLKSMQDKIEYNNALVLSLEKQKKYYKTALIKPILIN